MLKRGFIITQIAFLFFFFTPDLYCESFPKNRISIISPWREKSLSDILARYLAKSLKPQLPGPLSIDVQNRFDKDRSDTLSYSLSDIQKTGLRLLLYDNYIPILTGDPNISDFRSIGTLAEIPFVLVASKKYASEFNQNLKATLKKDEATIIMFNWDKYSLLIAERLEVLFNKTFNKKFVDDYEMHHTEFMRIPYSFSIISLRSPINKWLNVIEPIALLAEKRVEWLDKIPTAKEKGIDITASIIFALLAPKNTSDHIAQKIETAVTNIIKTSDFQEFTKSMNMIPLLLSSDETIKRIQIVSIDYCEKCTCSEKKCKENCKKCKE